MMLYVPDDVLEETSAASHQMLSKRLKLHYQKELKNLRVNENH
jgi:hypothetical protein